MRLTIGMASYDNYAEAWFTIQALRMYHDLTDCEILIVDNYGSESLRNFVQGWGGDQVRYIRDTTETGTAWAKNKVFEHARGDIVLCIDSHVFLQPGALESIHETDDLIQGPLKLAGNDSYYLAMVPVWRSHMWGIWADPVKSLPDNPIEIWGMGMGCFYTSRKSWLKYNEKFRGFGGEEGYIHEKYKLAGKRVISDPALVWQHYFREDLTSPPYHLSVFDKARNYMIGFQELGLDTKPLIDAFGKDIISKVKI